MEREKEREFKFKVIPKANGLNNSIKFNFVLSFATTVKREEM